MPEAKPETHLTVGEIWQLALPAGAKVIAGEAGLCRRVEWVAALRATLPLFGALEKGYLVLARLDLAQRLDNRVTPRYLIEELERIEAAGLVVAAPLAAADVALADALFFPVLCLPPGADLRQVERDILRTLVDVEGQLALREREVRQHLQQLLARGGLQAVLTELAQVAGGEAKILDPGQKVIATSAPGVRPQERPTAASSRPAQMELPITFGGRTLGRLVVHHSKPRCTPLELIHARQAAELCGVEMLQGLVRQETEERLGIDLVEQILRGEDEEALAARCQRLGYDISPARRHVVLALAAPREDAPGAACRDLARDLQWLAQRDEVGTLIVFYRRYLLLLCSLGPAVGEQRARFWLQEALAQESAGRCSVGVSRVLIGLEGLRQAIPQAMDSWELGQRIGDRPSPYFYEELGLYRLLAGLRARDEVKRFYQETLEPLVRYDQTHNTELVHTLEIFFEQNANASQTARALYIHRNTLNYRLQRIMEITGLDLNDAEVRLALQVALKIYHLTG